MFVIMREGATAANEEFYALWRVSLIMRLVNQEGWDGLACVTLMREWEMHIIYSECVMEMSLLRDFVCVCVCVRACVLACAGELY